MRSMVKNTMSGVIRKLNIIDHWSEVNKLLWGWLHVGTYVQPALERLSLEKNGPSMELHTLF